VLSHFRTLKICGSIATGRREAVRVTIFRYHSFNFRFQLMRQRILLSYHCSAVSIATCRKTYFPQFFLLQYKAKSYISGFQNLGCHCKILGCHVTPKEQLKNTYYTTPSKLIHIYCKVHEKSCGHTCLLGNALKLKLWIRHWIISSLKHRNYSICFAFAKISNTYLFRKLQKFRNHRTHVKE